jgi:hypothetical protein
MDVGSVSGVSLAKLLPVGNQIEQRESPEWASEDRRCMLKHQLDAQLLIDLGDTAEMQFPAFSSFRDVVQAQRPPEELLRLIKHFAKGTVRDADTRSLREVATVLYYVALSQAKLAGYAEMSALPGEDFVAGIRSLLNEGWLDRDVRALLERAISP